MVWATSAAFLNDHSEVALGFDLIGKRLRELAWPVAGAVPAQTNRALPGRLQEFLDELEQALLIKHEGFADEWETRSSVVVWPARDNPAAPERLGRLVSHRATGYGVTPYLRLTGADPDNQRMDQATVSRAGRLPIRAVAVSPSPNGAAATSPLRQPLAANGYNDAAVLRSAIPFRAG